MQRLNQLGKRLTADLREKSAETAEDSAISSDSEVQFMAAVSSWAIQMQLSFYVGNVRNDALLAVIVAMNAIGLRENWRQWRRHPSAN
ncbi:MAG: hypothetical protein H0X30_23275 [Anaerolineae bacterium]|nr:hypothetical protein [Anaerolineae bacterium]